MEDILDLYAEADDPLYPVVCFDERRYQLVSEVIQPIPAQPGQRKPTDYMLIAGDGTARVALNKLNR